MKDHITSRGASVLRGARAIQRVWVALTVLVLAVFGSSAFARTIEIISADRLEFRNVTPPNGKTQELVIITGKPALIKIDDDELEADRIEYNKTKRILSVVGAGTYRSKTETVAGKDFSVDLETEGLQGEDVLVATKEIDVIGVTVERVPGQLDVVDGYFSPCGRCGRTPNDYAFRAQSLTIYPGDRLIGKNVTVLIADEPVLFLPIVVLLLNDPARQPRVTYSRGSNGSGSSFEADLPFVTGEFGLGFTFLRFYELRDPAWGYGFDWTLYNLLGFTNRSRVFFLALPPADSTRRTSAGERIPSSTGALFAYQINTQGELEINPTGDPEDRVGRFSFSAAVSRLDDGITQTERNLRVQGANKRTDFRFEFGLDNANLALALLLNGFLDHRDQGAPGSTPSTRRGNAPFIEQYQPEIRFTAKEPLLPKFGPVSLSSLQVAIGRITAPANRLNRTANTDAAKDTGYITAGRLALTYSAGLNWQPWPGGILSASNNFTGRYYTTRNSTVPGGTDRDGEFERNVNIGIQAAFTQSLFDNRVSFSARYGFQLIEGESPFQFDAVGTRPTLTEVASLEARAQPLPWLGLTASDQYDFRKASLLSVGAPEALKQAFPRETQPVKWAPANFGLNISPSPLSASLNAQYDLERNEPVLWNITVGNNVPSGVSFRASTGYQYVTTPTRIQAQQQNLTVQPVPRFNDLVFTVGYASPDAGRFRFSVTLTDNINTGEIRNWGLQSTWILGERDSPITLSFNQNLIPPQFTNTTPAQPDFRTNGNFSAAFNGLRFTLANTLDFKEFTYAPPSRVLPPSTITATLGSDGQGGSGDTAFSVSWNLQFQANIDLDPLEFYNHRLVGSVSFRSPELEFSFSGQLNFPNRTQGNFELSQFSLNFGWDVVPGFSIQGNVTYQRFFSGGVYQDQFTFNPLGFTFAFAQEGSSKPEVFLTVLFTGTYVYRSDQPGFPFFNGEPNPTIWRPKFILTFDRCCYSLQFIFDATPSTGGQFSVSFILPTGQKQGLLETDSSAQEIRFPFLGFLIDPIKLNPPPGGSR